jgi:hypothetical protein
VLTAAAAVCLVIALAVDVSRAGRADPAALWLAVIGFALIAFGAIFPRWPRRHGDDHSRAQAPTCDDTEAAEDER